MTNLEQAAKESHILYINNGASVKQWVDLGMPAGKSGEAYSAFVGGFLAGAAHAEGAFAEWCDDNGWKYQGNHLWEQSCCKGNGAWKTTSELYQLWQQSLS